MIKLVLHFFADRFGRFVMKSKQITKGRSAVDVFLTRINPQSCLFASVFCTQVAILSFDKLLVY